MRAASTEPLPVASAVTPAMSVNTPILTPSASLARAMPAAPSARHANHAAARRLAEFFTISVSRCAAPRAHARGPARIRYGETPGRATARLPSGRDAQVGQEPVLPG